MTVEARTTRSAGLPTGTGRLETRRLGTFELDDGTVLPDLTVAYRHDGISPRGRTAGPRRPRAHRARPMRRAIGGNRSSARDGRSTRRASACCARTCSAGAMGAAVRYHSTRRPAGRTAPRSRRHAPATRRAPSGDCSTRSASNGSRSCRRVARWDGHARGRTGPAGCGRPRRADRRAGGDAVLKADRDEVVAVVRGAPAGAPELLLFEVAQGVGRVQPVLLEEGRQHASVGRRAGDGPRAAARTTVVTMPPRPREPRPRAPRPRAPRPQAPRPRALRRRLAVRSLWRWSRTTASSLVAARVAPPPRRAARRTAPRSTPSR